MLNDFLHFSINRIITSRVILMAIMLVTSQVDAQDIPQNGLELWLKADAGVITEPSSKAILKWEDQSGRQYYVDNIDHNDGIVLVNNQTDFNGKPVISFPSTSNKGLVLKNKDGKEVEIAISGDYQTFIVMKPNSSVGNVGFFLGGSNTKALYGLWENGLYVRGGSEQSGFKADKLTWRTSTDLVQLGLQRNHTADDSVNYFINGGTFTYLKENSTTNKGHHYFGTVGGANRDNSLGWDGYIAEVIIYKSCDVQTRLRVNDYLSAKYGFTQSEFTDTNQLSNNFSIANKYISIAGNDNGVVYQPTRNNVSPDFSLQLSNTVNGDMVMYGETDESGLTFSNAPVGLRVWNKKVYVEKTGNSNLTLAFDIKNYEGHDNTFNGNRKEDDYTLVYSSNNTNYTVVQDVKAVFDGNNKVTFSVSHQKFNGNGYYTLASKSPKAFYTKASGKWSDAAVWTTDPSGADDGMNAVPGPTSDIVILPSYTVTIENDSLSAGIVEINQGGTLKIGKTVDHSFLEVNGKGIIELESDNFPSSENALGSNGFLTVNGGIVVFKGDHIELTNITEYNTVHVDLGATDRTITLLSDVTIHDALLVNSGQLIMGGNPETLEGANLVVKGAFKVEKNARVSVGNLETIHTISLEGDFINNGTVELSNRVNNNVYDSEAYYSKLNEFYNQKLSGQYAILTFNAHDKDQSLISNGPTRLYQMVVNKGTTDNYALHVSASDRANLEFYGYNNYNNATTGAIPGSMNTENGMIVLTYGTLHLSDNIYIPVFSNSTENYDLGYGSKLWIDEGAQVGFGPIDGLTVYGTLLVDGSSDPTEIDNGGHLVIGKNRNGENNLKYNSITLREQGVYIQNGGKVDLNQFKTSSLGSNHQGSFTMNGGELMINGYSAPNYPAFVLPYKSNSFTMTGGKITIRNEQSGLRDLLKLGMSEGYYSVSGGEIVLELNKASDANVISSVPFYNLTIKGQYPSNKVRVSDIQTAYGQTLPNDGNLKVLNDLTIEAGGNLAVGNFNATIYGNMTLNDQSNFTIGSNNNLIFKGDKKQLDIRFKDKAFEIDAVKFDLPNKNSVFSITSGNLDFTDHTTRLVAHKNLELRRGTLDFKNYTIEAKGNFYVGGVFGSSTTTGLLKLNGVDKIQSINSVYASVKDQLADTTNVKISNLWIQSEKGIELRKSLYVSHLIWEKGYIKANTYGLIIGPEGMVEENNQPITKDLDNTVKNRFIVGTGLSSDGGLTYYVDKDEEYYYPLASNYDKPQSGTYKLTPANLKASNVSTPGFIQLSVNNEAMSYWTADGINEGLLDYYWQSTHYNFPTDDASKRPDLVWEFSYNEEDVEDDISTFVPGMVEVDLAETKKERISFTTSIDVSNQTFSTDKVDAYDAIFSAGRSDKFEGELKLYYSFWGKTQDKDGNEIIVPRDANWNDENRWTTNANWKTSGSPYSTHGVPTDGDIIVVGYGNYGLTGNDKDQVSGHRVVSDTDHQVAVIQFESHKDATFEKANLARIRVLSNTLTSGVTEGIGSFRIYTNSNANVSSNDMNTFLSEKRNELMWQVESDDFVLPIYSKYPSVRLYSSSGKTTSFAPSVSGTISMKNLMVDGGTLKINKSISVENTINIGGFNKGRIEIDSDKAISISCTTINLENTITDDGNIGNKLLVTGEADVVHRLIVKGSISIPEKDEKESGEDEIEFNLYNGLDKNKVILETRVSRTNSFTNFYASTVVPHLYKLDMNKGTSTAHTFTMSTNFTLPNDVNEELIILRHGSLVLNHQDINIKPVNTNGQDWTIKATSGINIKQGIVSIESDQSNIVLEGQIAMNGGQLNLANASKENSIIYKSGGEIILNGGTVNIGSELRRDINAESASLSYSQEGGQLFVGKENTPNSATRGTLEIVGSESTFNFADGEIVVDKGNIQINPAYSKVEPEAFIILGNNSSKETLQIDIASTIGSFRLADGTNVTVNSVNSLDLKGDLIIEANTDLLMNGNDLILDGDLENNGQLNLATSTFKLAGLENQIVGGSNEILSKELIITKSTSKATLSNNITVLEDMFVETGIISDGGHIIFVGGNLDVEGKYQSIDEGRIMMNGASVQELIINGKVGRLELNNTDLSVDGGVKLIDDLDLSVEELVFTQGTLNIGKHALNLSSEVNIITTSAFSATNMILMSGGHEAEGVSMTLPNSMINASSPVILPIGYNGIYAPVSFVGNYEGANVIVKSVKGIHPIASTVDEAQGINDIALEQYWAVEFDKEGTNRIGRYITFQYEQANVKENSTVSEEDYWSVIVDDNDQIQKIDPSLDDSDNNSIDVESNLVKVALTASLFSGDYFIGAENSTPDNILYYKIAEGITTASLTNVAYGEWLVKNYETNTFDMVPEGNSIPSGSIIEIPEGTKLVSSNDGTLGVRTFYRTIIDGEFNFHISDKSININEVETNGTGVVHYYINEDDKGQLPNADWTNYFDNNGSLTIEGNISNYQLEIDAPKVDQKVKMGSLTLKGTSTNPQEWTLAVNEGLAMDNGTLTVEGIHFDLSSTSTLQNMVVLNNAEVVSNSYASVLENVLVDNSSSLSITSQTLSVKGDVVVEGNLEISNSSLEVNTIDLESNSNLTISSANLVLAGNFNDKGANASLSNSAKIIFNGASEDQFFNGEFSATEVIPELVINKANGLVILDNQVKHINTLTLHSVLSNKGNNDGTLMIIGDQQINGDSYVSGPVSTLLSIGEDFIFPTGGNDNKLPVGVHYTKSIDGIDTKTWTAEYLELSEIKDIETVDVSTVGEVSKFHQWRVNDNINSMTSGESEATIDAYYGSEKGQDIPDLLLATWDETLPYEDQMWTSEDNSVIKEEYLETQAISFSEKYLAIGVAGNDSPDLPVELISFEAKAEEENVNLYWSTATEINNDYFEVQKSFDNRNWTTIGEIEGAGNSNVRNDYEFIDEDVAQGSVVYYRLIQYDFDGTVTYIDPIKVTLKRQGDFGPEVAIYPNPTNGEDVNLMFTSWSNDVRIEMYNTVGNIVLVDEWKFGTTAVKPLEVQKLPHGVYIIRFSSENKVISKRVVIE